jgi:hypothetical protein
LRFLVAVDLYEPTLPDDGFLVHADFIAGKHLPCFIFEEWRYLGADGFHSLQDKGLTPLEVKRIWILKAETRKTE